MLNTYKEFINLSNHFLLLRDSLIDKCRTISAKELASNLSSDDILVIIKLFNAGIQVLYFFEVILRFDKYMAEKLLIDKYIGNYVNPDRKGRGYELEISTMLEDYFDIEGQENLIEFLNNDQVSLTRLLDKRVMNNLCEILNKNESEILFLLKKRI